MKIEALSFGGCPSYEALLPRLRAIAAERGAEGDIDLRAVETLDAAEQQRFLGSPTVRVDGRDVGMLETGAQAPDGHAGVKRQ